jgi:dihydropteroate synthase
MAFAARTCVMGVLNMTPDSFSDGGSYSSARSAADAALAMIEEGADIIDIGGESTRPGRPDTVTPEEECRRILPVLEMLRAEAPDAVISIDTSNAQTAHEALERGAHIVNDVTALRKCPEIAGLCASFGAGVLLMHMQGSPETMQENPRYDDVIVDIGAFLRDRIGFALAQGIGEQNVAIDPGIGFGKTAEQNVEILAALEYLRLLQRPICIGASRKGFLGALTGGLSVRERLEPTIAAHCAAVLHGASIVRVHDVAAARRSLAVIDAIRQKL